MPTYAYACTACGNEFEAVQSITEAALTSCPECAGALRKVFHPVGVAFKGSGFYRNDSRAGSSGAKGGSPTTSSGESGSSGSSATKPGPASTSAAGSSPSPSPSGKSSASSSSSKGSNQAKGSSSSSGTG